jgi:hypothetical protein
MKRDLIVPAVSTWLVLAAHAAQPAPPGVAQTSPTVSTDVVITYNVALSLAGLHPTITQARLDCYANTMLTSAWTQTWAPKVSYHVMATDAFTEFTTLSHTVNVRTPPIPIQNRGYKGTQTVTFRLRTPIAGYVQSGPPTYSAVFGCQVQIADATGTFVVPLYIDEAYTGADKRFLPVGGNENAIVISHPHDFSNGGGKNIVDSAPVVFQAL